MTVRFLLTLVAAWLPTLAPLLCGLMCPGVCAAQPVTTCCEAPVAAMAACCGDPAAACETAPADPVPCCEVCPCDDPAPVPPPAHVPAGLDLPVAILTRPWPVAADDHADLVRLALRVVPSWSPGGGNSLQSVLCVWRN